MGVRTMALVTDMSEPLGRTVGNALEIKECISALRGKGAKDLMDLTLTLIAWMLNMADSLSEETPLGMMSPQTLNKYKNEALDFIEKGDAFKKFVEFIDAQHGDPEAAFAPASLPNAPLSREIKAERDGFVKRLDALAVGMASMLLGAGRSKAGEAIDPGAGIILNKKVGEPVKAGEQIAALYASDEGLFRDAEEAFLSGFETGDREPARRALVREVILPG
jgi:pyrimidine-nucleoside phosphorylase